MIYIVFSRFLSSLDLKFDSMTYSLLRMHAKDSYEPRQTCFLSTHGVFAIEHFFFDASTLTEVITRFKI